MLAQAEVERREYESPIEAEMDYATFIRGFVVEAEKRGFAAGYQKGIEIGSEIRLLKVRKLTQIVPIRIYQRLLKKPQQQEADLLKLTFEQLSEMSQSLENEHLAKVQSTHRN